MHCVAVSGRRLVAPSVVRLVVVLSHWTQRRPSSIRQVVQDRKYTTHREERTSEALHLACKTSAGYNMWQEAPLAPLQGFWGLFFGSTKPKTLTLNRRDRVNSIDLVCICAWCRLLCGVVNRGASIGCRRGAAFFSGRPRSTSSKSGKGPCTLEPPGSAFSPPQCRRA